MGWVLTSERELPRVEVLPAVLSGRQTVTQAARLLSLSRRQAHRLIKAYRTDGASAVRHKARGRRSNRALSDGLRDLALTYVRERNAFVSGFMESFNSQFARTAIKSDDLHRGLNLPVDRLSDILAWREQRDVGQHLALSYKRQRLILDESDLAGRRRVVMSRSMSLPMDGSTFASKGYRSPTAPSTWISA